MNLKKYATIGMIGIMLSGNFSTTIFANQNEATEVNQNEATEVNQDEVTEVNQDEVTEVNQDEVTEVNQDEVTEVNQDEATEEDLADMIQYKDVEYFVAELDKYTQGNPNATEMEQDKFLANKMVEFYKKDKPKTRSKRSIDYASKVAGLNSKEKALYKQSPSKGLRCMQAGLVATRATNSRFVKSSRHNGNGDSFRHSLWNALMVKLTGSSWASKWATAHEDGAGNQPYIERQMDLSNNAYGRALGRRLGNKPDHVYINQLLLDVKNGKLKRIVSNKLVKTSGSARL